jgi:glycine/D-amino acid oxidase-like deaminating enzyme
LRALNTATRTVSRRGALAALAAGAGATLWPRGAPAAKAKLAPVIVSRDRILRTIVGLRPFRPSGFVVRAERLGDKVLVHNYGHGGCGVTLCWGTAELAADEVAHTSVKRVAILGCGAVGLATARLLQQRGLAATIYTRDQPPATTSDIAGGRFYPFDVFDRNVATPQFLATLWRAARRSYAAFAALPAHAYGIHRYPTYACRTTPFAPESLLNFGSPVHDLLPGLRDLPPEESPFPYPIVRTFETMLIEPAVYLPAVLRDFRRAGGRVVTRTFSSPTDVATLKERAIVNCTGLGSAALFGDKELVPIKGQLTVLRPQPEVDYVTLPPDLYMFPRTDGIVLGGTFERGNWTLEPDPAAEARILAGHAKFFSTLPGAPAAAP